jgi:hypothetical protein
MDQVAAAITPHPIQASPPSDIIAGTKYQASEIATGATHANATRNTTDRRLELVSKPCQARVLSAASPTGCSDENHSNGGRLPRPAGRPVRGHPPSVLKPLLLTNHAATIVPMQIGT